MTPLVAGIAFLAVLGAVYTVQASGVTPKKTTVTVTVGAPSELAVKLSKASNLTAGPIAFSVANKGKSKHTFKVCTKAVTKLANSCVGKSVAVASGKTGTLSVTLTKGKYEYLSTAPGFDTLGKKGWLGIGLSVPAAQQSIPSPSAGGGGTPTTTPPANGGGGGGGGALTFPAGNAANGPGLWSANGCGGCHVMAAAGGTGTVGPNLDQVQPDFVTAANQIYGGGGEMPAYNGTLSKQQIADLAQYVANSTHH